MGQMILIDSNIYIGLLRQGIDPVQHLDKHYPIGDLASCGIVEAEVIRGIRFTKRRQHIAEFFSLLQRIPTPSALWDEVSDLAWTLDRKARAGIASGDAAYRKRIERRQYLHVCIPRIPTG